MCACVCVCVCVCPPTGHRVHKRSREGKSSVWGEFSVSEHLRSQMWFNKVTVELCLEVV